MPAKQRRVPDAALNAVRLLMDVLASDAEFVEGLTATEIQRRVDAGELIPAERLRLTGGLELAPVGLVGQLAQTVRDLLAILDDQGIDGYEEVLDSARALVEDPEDEAPPPDPDEGGGPADDDPPSTETAAPEPAPAKPPAREPKREARRGPNGERLPSGFPDPDDAGGTFSCATCGTAVDFEQALLSWTLNRSVACPTCHTKR